MKTLKLFLLPVLDSLEFGWRVIRYALIFVSAFFRQRASLGCEMVAIRSQLTFYEESIRQKRQRRPRFHPAFRLLWVLLSSVWTGWKSAAELMKPKTVLKWHEHAFLKWWRWKSRRKGGRPTISQEMRALIRRLSRENVLWSAETIHGHLVLLGFDPPCPDTIRKYMAKPKGGTDKSQTWLTFLRNHLPVSWAMDFFTVPTLRFQILYIFVILNHSRRQVVHFAVTPHPTTAWVILDSIAGHEPMDYEVSMGIPEPPGELESKGKFGPWEDGEIGKIPLSGSVKLSGAKLNKYSGLGGTIQSEERFGGTLEQVEVTGEASAPDFELVSAGHKVELRTQFDVIVNAVKGEAQLKAVAGRVGQTRIHVRGGVVENAKSDHREASLDFSITNGRAEDLLWVFSRASKPAMIGPAVCSGHVRMRKFGDGFLDALEANGKFEVKNGHFQRTMQVKTNVLSARAQGKKIKGADDAPEVAVENLSSEVKIGNGVAHLTSTYFQVPGARVRTEGTYKIENAQVDLHGNLWTDASLSDNTTGIKTMLLEPLDPLFRRKHAGSMMGVSMEGDIHQPRIGTVLTKKKAPWGKQQQNSNIEIIK